jgi:hypothetical protein
MTVKILILRNVFIYIFILLLSDAGAYSQATQDSSSFYSIKNKHGQREISGRVVDRKTGMALPYTNIYILWTGKGSISNENGYFSIDVTGLDDSDTVRFQYIGYKTLEINIGQLMDSATVFLEEEIYDLAETLIFGEAPDPKTIVKRVVQNKELNYKRLTSVRQAFIRNRDITDIDKFEIDYKKSTIPGLTIDTIEALIGKIPRHTTSFTDFLGDIYCTAIPDDSLKLKVDPVRSIALKEKEIDDSDQYEALFNTIFTDTVEQEYWKIKSGIFGEKIEDIDGDNENGADSAGKDNKEVYYLGRRINNQLLYSYLEDEDRWEFLYKTGRYDYILAGGTSFNGEDVYIIDFTPAGSGHFTGRLYISVATYALIRADYEYAPGKTGRDIHLFGIGYTEDYYSGSICFEKHDSCYTLKYFSNKARIRATVERQLEISKKRRRALFPKELMEFDATLDIALRTENSTEFYILDEKAIDKSEYDNFRQKDHLETIFVDQFDDSLWDGYSIIEPTRQMREYRKQGGE